MEIESVWSSIVQRAWEILRKKLNVVVLSKAKEADNSWLFPQNYPNISIDKWTWINQSKIKESVLIYAKIRIDGSGIVMR